MSECPSAGLRRRLPHKSVAYAHVRRLFSRHPLPPGKLVNLHELEASDRCFLLHHAEQVGPIFKAIAWDEFWVCIQGIQRCRRFLKEHGEHVRAITLSVGSMFPRGFLRQMEGDAHRRYRQSLARAIRPADFTAIEGSLEAMTRRELAAYAGSLGESAPTPTAYVATLNTVASAMLIQAFFGLAPGSELFDRILAGYRKLGPFGLVWNPGDRQREAFAEIRDLLLQHLVRNPGQAPAGARASILGRLVDEGTVDDTMMGNLIYMVEMGRYDMYSLFRWLTKYVGDLPAMAARLAAEESGPTAAGGSFAERFVLETLRTDKSERLLRKVLCDVVFDGFLIPRHATVRLCLWEAHKDPGTFANPFRFDPDRFASDGPGPDEFAPFGLDHHVCPLGDMAIRASILFLRALTKNHRVVPTADGLPVLGPYHWEPASRFAVRLEPRAGATAGA